MQICTLTQTPNHASIPPLSFLQAGCPSCHPTNSVKALKANRSKPFYTQILSCDMFEMQKKTPVMTCRKYHWLNGRPLQWSSKCPPPVLMQVCRHKSWWSTSWPHLVAVHLISSVMQSSVLRCSSVVDSDICTSQASTPKQGSQADLNPGCYLCHICVFMVFTWK